MPALPFPDGLIPHACELELASTPTVFVSPFTGARQTVRRGGDTLRLRLAFRALDAARRRRLEAFVARVGGHERFRVHDFSHVQGGALGGTPLVDGADQRGTTLQTDGWTPDTFILKAGDHLSVAFYLYIVTADVRSALNGGATIPVYPSIPRSAPADNAVIATNQPPGTWMLLRSEVTFDHDPAFSRVTLVAEQDVLT